MRRRTFLLLFAFLLVWQPIEAEAHDPGIALVDLGACWPVSRVAAIAG